jgi:hypothetical protein
MFFQESFRFSVRKVKTLKHLFQNTKISNLFTRPSLIPLTSPVACLDSNSLNLETADGVAVKLIDEKNLWPIAGRTKRNLIKIY